MAQLRQHHDQIVNRGAAVLVVGPDDHEAFAQYWQRESLPFTGLADPDHKVADLYGQRVSMLRLGRLPTLLVVDKQGLVRFRHDGESMRDTVGSRLLLAVLDALEAETDRSEQVRS